MLFNSFEFLLFFPIVTILFFVLPHRFRWSLLLTASCFFYMFFIPVYILILFGTIIIDYFAGIYLEKTTAPSKKKIFLICSLIANIGVLAVFKYYNFFLDNINDVALALFDKATALRYLAIALPIGLSFHTFQAMSYTFEVYYGRQKAEKHFGLYALYVMFYPQLVAGPIERPQNILHQFHQKQTFDYQRLSSGLRMMIWGLFKKVVIADNLSGMVNLAYTQPEEHTGMTLLLTTYFFAFQIYCDFSGYSDMAIGAARVMGYDLMENFRTPYLSASIKEFWSRWHISLSTWFRDYLYIPLGGNRKGTSRWMLNLFLVFLISGIWHGANWTYVVWGSMHGGFLMVAILKDNLIKKSKFNIFSNHAFIRPLHVFITFQLASFAWIFFRANNIHDASHIVQKIAHTDWSMQSLSNSLHVLAENPKNFGRTLFILCMMGLFYFMDPYVDKIIKGRILLSKSYMKYALYSFIVSCIILFGFFGKVSFIYFQF